jgi:hypothetical protein
MLVAIHVQYMHIYNVEACYIRLLKTFLFFCINTPQKLMQVRVHSTEFSYLFLVF